MPTAADISAELDRLSQFDAGPYPVVSLYLNLQPNQHGRDDFERFVRKELDERLRTYPAGGTERDSLQRDAERIRQRLASIEQSANGLALFACSGADLFEALELAAPIPEHRLVVAHEPHLFPLARMLDEHATYAVLLADRQSARIFVVALDAVQRVERIEGEKIRQHKMGGWSQARYQRHMENYQLQHTKETAEVLSRIAREERIESIILAGDDGITAMLRDELPKDIAQRVVDVLKLGADAPEHEVLRATRAAMLEKDVESDRDRIDALLDTYRSNGLATVRFEACMEALQRGQVDELVVAADPHALRAGSGETADDQRAARERAADALVAMARQTAAKIRFIEDTALVEPIGGVGAFLRFTL